ncbi:hypothetical protein ACPXB3_14590 [Gordonia sp. DT219]|uniref:hypothetical protein n=1 Tax=Gordonia sp. DT219 TaxID=3416658 RepID=UPI003CFA4E20
MEMFSDITSRTVLSEDPEEAEEEVVNILRIVGDYFLYAIFYPWPDGVSVYDDVKATHEYMQTTGTQDGLTVEWKRDGHLVALGHPTGSTEHIDLAQKDDSTIAVHRNEVFSPDEAIALFTEYLTTDTIDTTHLSVREIGYGEDTDEA